MKRHGSIFITFLMILTLIIPVVTLSAAAEMEKNVTVYEIVRQDRFTYDAEANTVIAGSNAAGAVNIPKAVSGQSVAELGLGKTEANQNARVLTFKYLNEYDVFIALFGSAAYQAGGGTSGNFYVTNAGSNVIGDGAFNGAVTIKMPYPITSYAINTNGTGGRILLHNEPLDYTQVTAASGSAAASGTTVLNRGTAAVEQGFTFITILAANAGVLRVDAWSVTMTVPEETEPVVDKSSLVNLINYVKTLDPNDYLTESWIALEEALAAAEIVVSNINATNEDVQSAYDILNSAVGKLKSKENVVGSSGLSFNDNGGLIATAYDNDLLVNPVEYNSDGTRKQPTHFIYVAPHGKMVTKNDNVNGVAVEGGADGTFENPFYEIREAVWYLNGLTDLEPAFKPGEVPIAIRVLPGNYYNRRMQIEGIHGTEENPIWIGGWNPETPGDPIYPGLRPRINNVTGSAVTLRKSSWIILHDLELTNEGTTSRYYCLNADDGGATFPPDAVWPDAVDSKYLVFRGLYAHDCGDSPIKLSGLYKYWFYDNEVSHGFIVSRGSANIDQVACHYGTLAYNYIHDANDNGIGFKGGSTNGKVHNNIVANMTGNSIMVGQNTGWQLFRPFLVKDGTMHEASLIDVYSNIIIGGNSSIGFQCGAYSSFVNNTVILPQRWVLRIIRGSITDGTGGMAYDVCQNAQSHGNVIANNIIYYDGNSAGNGLDVPNMEPDIENTNVIMNNLFYEVSNPARILQNFGRNGIYRARDGGGNIFGEDPLFIGSENMISALIDKTANIPDRVTKNITMVETWLSLQEDSPALATGSNGGVFALEYPAFTLSETAVSPNMTVPAKTITMQFDFSYVAKDFRNNLFSQNERTIGAIHVDKEIDKPESDLYDKVAIFYDDFSTDKIQDTSPAYNETQDPGRTGHSTGAGAAYYEFFNTFDRLQRDFVGQQLNNRNGWVYDDENFGGKPYTTYLKLAIGKTVDNIKYKPAGNPETAERELWVSFNFWHNSVPSSLTNRATIGASPIARIYGYGKDSNGERVPFAQVDLRYEPYEIQPNNASRDPAHYPGGFIVSDLKKSQYDGTGKPVGVQDVYYGTHLMNDEMEVFRSVTGTAQVMRRGSFVSEANPIHYSQRWWKIEIYVKLNTPGKADGAYELWVDGELDASAYNLDWTGMYDEYGLNEFVILNLNNQEGVPGAPTGWLGYDNLTVSRIRNPEIITEYNADLARFHLNSGKRSQELSSDRTEYDIVMEPGTDILELTPYTEHPDGYIISDGKTYVSGQPITVDLMPCDEVFTDGKTVIDAKNTLFLTVVTPEESKDYNFNVGRMKPYIAKENPTEDWLWADNFSDTEGNRDKYITFGYNNNTSGNTFFPSAGKGLGGNTAMECTYKQHNGEWEGGAIHMSFGLPARSDAQDRTIAAHGEKLNELYCRFYLKLDKNWVGGGLDKLMRFMSMENSNSAQSMIQHTWSMGGANNHAYLGIDPATGIDVWGATNASATAGGGPFNNRLITASYNQTARFTWLGAKMGYNIPLFDEDHVGEWYCIEQHVKLNTPGKSDGVMELWIDGQLVVGSYNLNYQGSYDENGQSKGLNRIYLENYGANIPADQSRYWSNLVVSRSYIGPAEFVFADETPVITIETEPEEELSIVSGGDEVDVSVEASISGNASLSYQWYEAESIDGFDNAVAIDGAVSASYTVPSNLDKGTYYFFCKVSSDAKDAVSVNSRMVTVTVIKIPVITIVTQPEAETTVFEGETARIAVEASATEGAELTYQWYEASSIDGFDDAVAIEGAESAVFETPVFGEGVFYYFCRISAELAESIDTEMVVVTAEAIVMVDIMTDVNGFISMVETNKRVWTLSFKVTEFYSNGTTEIVTYSVLLEGNNANQDGSVMLENGYTLIYDIKGNGSNIKELRIYKQ